MIGTGRATVSGRAMAENDKIDWTTGASPIKLGGWDRAPVAGHCARRSKDRSMRDNRMRRTPVSQMTIGLGGEAGS